MKCVLFAIPYRVWVIKMAYRKCEKHGWLETSEYTVTPSGETICPMCETALTGYYGSVKMRDSIGGPTHKPRKEFMEKAREFMEKTENMSTQEYQEERPVME